MDTYPPEFVIHLQPTLIVTGLTSLDNASDSSHQDQKAFNDSPPPPPPRPSAQGSSTSALEFQKSTLLQAMLSRNNVSYWDNTKGLAGSLFYVIPEQRSYVLPPTRKFLQQTGQQHLLPSLSPTSSSSPLYPDGLISPVFVKRHREQIPSVFIAIVDLWDRESTGADGEHQRNFSDKGPLGVIDPMEREHDIVLAQELLERRKAAQERSVKFATVILLQRSHMEDPAIEDRLNFVRKSAGLDNKNSFYVLPPSTAPEINDFAVNLQRSQYEGSMNYYKEQVKRHKKKKSNLPATSASVRPVQQQNAGVQQSALQHQGLSVQGWMLRYEFKMGMFSECKQDIDNAVKHYESAYGLLIDMFAVTSTITPGAQGLQARTRRWAEAKVLADCLCLKICKFHLYLDAPSTALFHFRRHLLVFKAFSESWRMGDDSFEYWAWLGKQYRVFGDLLDIGTKSGFKLPVPTPGSIVYGSFAGMTEGSKDLNKFSGIGLGGGTTGFGIGPGGDAYAYGGHVGGGRGGGTHGPGAGINPMLVLQHAGFFYHQAANCSVQRRLHFEMAEEAFPDSTVAPTPSASRPYPPSLQSMNAERGIDHLALTIELLTKSYEQFKRHKSGRMTLFLASEIAGTYYTAGKFEMALKFFERIGKTYRKEGWNLILTSILKWSIQCAKELGHWENVVEYLFEMMSPGLQTQQHQLPNQDAPPRRKWLDVIEDSTKLVFRNLDKGVRQPTELRVVPRESKVEIKTLFKSPAYLDEYFPVVIRVKNGETCPVQMEMDVDLQPIDATIESLDSILLDPYKMANTLASSKNHHASQSLRGIKLACRHSSSDSEDTAQGIPVGKWAEQTVFIRALEIPTPRTIVCKVRYEISTGTDGQNVEKRTLTEKLHSFRVLFIPPFDAEVDYVPQSNVSTDKGTTGDLVPILEPNNVDPALGSVLIPALTHKEQYLMSTRVNNEGPWPVQVKEVKLVIGSAMDALLDMETMVAGMTKDPSSMEPVVHTLARSHSISRARERKRMLHESGVHVDVVDENVEPTGVQSNGIQEWRSGNLVTFNHLIEVVAADLELAPEQIEVGFLHVKWRRFEENSAENNIPFTETNVPLQPLSLPKAEVFMTVVLPNYAQVNQPFTARYTIHNPTGRMHELAMTVEPTEGMVYAGTMQTTVKILPYASHAIQMNCYPLNAGLVRLPRLKLVVNKRKPVGRRANLKGHQQQAQAPGQGQGQGQGVQGDVIVKVKGARTASRSGSSESVVIFVKPEAGTIE
ncbi:hypothetical protein BGZ52_002720 [Haplosporangium bisporale]|nr:hypothetical protein BGZ52_002720 [Haplosporangium bisporale]